MFRAAGAPPGLAPGIRLAAAGALGSASWRRRTHRAAHNAAARSFLPDPVRAQGKRLDFALAATFGFPMSGALRSRRAAAPGALTVIARQLAVTCCRLSASADADPHATGTINTAGYTERWILVKDPPIGDPQRIAVGAIAGAAVSDNEDAPGAVEGRSRRRDRRAEQTYHQKKYRKRRENDVALHPDLPFSVYAARTSGHAGFSH